MVKVKVGPQVYLGLIRIYKLKHSIAHLICYIVRFTTIHILSQTLCNNVEMAESRLSRTMTQKSKFPRDPSFELSDIYQC